MRSIRNSEAIFRRCKLDFRSLGNALYPEHLVRDSARGRDFRSLGNALYPERRRAQWFCRANFRSLGNALYPELNMGGVVIM